MKSDELPFLEDGVFRDRGAENTRLETFVDAAFAFTLTLLVISFDEVPKSFEELIYALRFIPAFLASFTLLMMFWFAHRAWSRRYGLDTTGATLISMFLVFVLLVYVFPLRAMASAALSSLTGGWVPYEMSITTPDEARALFVIYGVGFLLASFSIDALYAYALRAHERLSLSEPERFLTRAEVLSWLMIGSSAIVSILVALLGSERTFLFAGWTYASLGIVMPFFGWRVHKGFESRFGKS
ncbi:MAG: TMEM175 family protein [Pseudomonadota bacterium]